MTLPSWEKFKNAGQNTPWQPLGEFLALISFWSQGNKTEASGGLQTILNDRQTPGCWADVAHYLLSHTSGIQFPVMEIPEFPTFEKLALASYERFELEQIPESFPPILEEIVKKSPEAPVSPLFMLLLLHISALAGNTEQIEARLSEIIRLYPGSSYESHARIRRIRLVLPTLQKLGAEARNSSDRERQIFLRERAQALTSELDQALDELLKRFIFQPEARQEVLRVGDAVQMSLDPGDSRRWLDRYVKRLAEHPEGTDLHMRLVMLTRDTAPADESIQLAVDHLRLFPQSPHRESMLFMRVSHRLEQEDLTTAIPMLRDLLSSGHPRFAPLAQDEIIRWLKARQHFSAAKRIPLCREIDRLPLDGRHGSEAAYLLADALKAQAARSNSRDREELIAQLLIVLDGMEDRFGENSFTTLAQALRREIHDGSFEAAVQVNRMSNWVIILGLTIWGCFYISTFFLQTWLFWVQTIMLFMVLGLGFIMHFVLGIF